MFFIIKKMITPFILPTGLFIIVLFVFGVVLIRRKQWRFGIVSFLIGLSMWIFSIVPVSGTILRGLEYSYNIPQNPTGDVIVLLGGGIFDGSPDISGVGTPVDGMVARIVTAVRLYRKLEIPIIVSTGIVFEHKKAEAPIVQRFLVDLGVPPAKIILEDKSRDTIENAKYTSNICKNYGFNKPILVTSAYHMKRSVLSFEKAGLKVLPFPTGFRTWHNREYGWEEYLPGNLDDAAIIIHEYSGLMFYKFAY